MDKQAALNRLEAIEKETKELKAIINKPELTIREQVEALPIGTLFRLTWDSGERLYRVRTSNGYLNLFTGNEYTISLLGYNNTDLTVITHDQLRKAFNDC